jgi:hypothetical protein
MLSNVRCISSAINETNRNRREAQPQSRYYVIGLPNYLHLNAVGIVDHYCLLGAVGILKLFPHLVNA